jgi:mono/diheme cytochrome c family protein
MAASIGLFAFQNCSLVNSSHTDLNSLGKTCLANAQRAFNESYYPHLRSQCSQCHDNGGAGISWFASKDPEFAFNAFMSTSREKVNLQMVNDGHPGPNNGPNQEAWVASQAAQWTSIDKQIDECTNSNAVTTVAKNTAVQTVTINEDADSNRRPWKVLEFNLDSELLNPDQNGKIQMLVRIRYRESGPGTIKAGVTGAGTACRNNTNVNNCEYLSDIGYEFSRPSARIRDTAPAGTQYAVDKLTILRNGVRLSTVTSFEAINDVVVGSTTDAVLLESGASPGILTSKDPANDVFSLRFAEIRDAEGRAVGGGGGGGGGGGPVVPAKVTYAELASGASQYGYFARNCFACHGAANPAGALDLTNYSAASLSSATIRSRVNNANRPMPPSGLLPQFDRDVISKWVDIGAPQN